jgi:hypothetical protein
LKSKTPGWARRLSSLALDLFILGTIQWNLILGGRDRQHPPSSFLFFVFSLVFSCSFFLSFVLSFLSLSLSPTYIYILLYNYIGLSENSLCPIPMDHQNDPHQNCWENTLDTPILYIHTYSSYCHMHIQILSLTPGVGHEECVQVAVHLQQQSQDPWPSSSEMTHIIRHMSGMIWEINVNKSDVYVQCIDTCVYIYRFSRDRDLVSRQTYTIIQVMHGWSASG